MGDNEGGKAEADGEEGHEAKGREGASEHQTSDVCVCAFVCVCVHPFVELSRRVELNISICSTQTRLVHS